MFLKINIQQFQLVALGKMLSSAATQGKTLPVMGVAPEKLATDSGKEFGKIMSHYINLGPAPPGPVHEEKKYKHKEKKQKKKKEQKKR